MLWQRLIPEALLVMISKFGQVLTQVTFPHETLSLHPYIVN